MACNRLQKHAKARFLAVFKQRGAFWEAIEVDPSPPDAALHMHRCDALCSIALYVS